MEKIKYIKTMVQYKVTIIEANKGHIFKSINKAKEFIVKWCFENNQHTGKLDIDKRTLLWHVGTWQKPIIQFEKLTTN
jgi:hypothetical protein